MGANQNPRATGDGGGRIHEDGAIPEHPGSDQLVVDKLVEDVCGLAGVLLPKPRKKPKGVPDSAAEANRTGYENPSAHPQKTPPGQYLRWTLLESSMRDEKKSRTSSS